MVNRKPETEHVQYVCPGHEKDWGYSSCQFCDGGLFACTECNAFEGAMTTHCPRREVEEWLWDEVYRGNIDYRFGVWTYRPSRFSPAWWTKHKDRVRDLVTNFQDRMDTFGRARGTS